MGRRQELKDKLPSYTRYIFSALRRIWRWSPERKEALVTAKIGRDLYRCVICHAGFKRKFVAVDHIAPVISPATGFEGWDIYIKRLFCPAANLQVICKACHSTKTKAENKERRKRAA